MGLERTADETEEAAEFDFSTFRVSDVVLYMGHGLPINLRGFQHKVTAERTIEDFDSTASKNNYSAKVVGGDGSYRIEWRKTKKNEN